MIMESATFNLIAVFLFYGLAFFSMGLAIILEGGKGSDIRLQLALRPLAAFGIIHGLHEWMDMYEQIGLLSTEDATQNLWVGLKLCMLAFSFLSLAGFGFSSIAPNLKYRRISLLAPLLLASIWGVGILLLKGRFSAAIDLRQTAEVWTRYSLGIPSALIAAIGLILQQRSFRMMGMAQFGRDSLVAAIAFAWYGIVGQLFVRPSRLPPSTFLNEELFFYWFHVPIQVLRAGIAIVVAVSVIRLMRSFDYEIRRKVNALQQAKLKEAEHREEMRGKLLKQVVDAQEAERLRIARELHDDTGQMLTAISLGLRGLSNSLLNNPAQSHTILQKLASLTANSLTELQRIISNLRPAQLDDLGLPAALRWYVGETGRQVKDLEIELSINGGTYQLSPSVEVAIFRIVQEAITNVLKHAHAKKVDVDLCYQPDHLTLEVRDDGIGMNLEKLLSEDIQSWGMHGMRERATLLGGEFIAESNPNNGLSIIVTIPTRPDTQQVLVEGTEDA